MATDTGDETGQRTLLVRCLQEDDNKERIPPDRSRALNVCSHQGGGGWIPLTWQRAPTARSQGSEGDP